MPRVKKEDSGYLEKSARKDVLEDKLIENMIELQKVHANLLEKFDKLSTQINSLLNLFEVAARSFAQAPSNQTVERDKGFLDKIDGLLEQNKTIAKGLTLMEERVRGRVYGSPQEQMPPQQDQFAPSRDLLPEEKFSPSVSSKPLPKF